MREVLGHAARWWDADIRFALATVVSTSLSAPRMPGTTMAVSADGTVIGSVSGGCVESAVVSVAQDVMHSGRAELLHYGISSEEAVAVGLTCGGEMDVFVQPVNRDNWPWFGTAVAALAEEREVAVATVVAGGAPLGARMMISDEIHGTFGNEGLDYAVTADARGMLQQGQSGIRHYGPRGERRCDDVAVFVQAFAPRPQLLVFGATDFAAALTRFGRILGYHVTVCDARAPFATRERFPDADDVVVAWPHRFLAGISTNERTVICVLTHDPKFDVPLLKVALRKRAAYVGAMGSRQTHDKRLAQLREVGLTDAELAALHSPIGLDIGGRTPEEAAVSIVAEIICTQSAGTGRPLRSTSGPIHDDGPRATSAAGEP